METPTLAPRGPGSDRLRRIQAALNRALRWRIAEDGRAGPETRRAVIEFQRRHGLVPDGVVGPRTEAALTDAVRPDPTRRGRPRLDTPCADVRQPSEDLVAFGFDDHRVTPPHRVQIARIARCVAGRAAAGVPVRVVRVVGHTDPVGDETYNLNLGFRRANEVARALREELERALPGLGLRTALVVDSRGEGDPVPGDAARSRRVQVFVPLPARQPLIVLVQNPPAPPVVPPPVVRTGWAPPVRADEAGRGATDRFAPQTMDCGAFSIFVPSAAAQKTVNNVHVFFSPGAATGASGSNAVLVHGLRGAASLSDWIVIGVPGVLGGAFPITQAQIVACLRTAGRPGQIDRIRLSAHSRGNAGLAATLAGRLITSTIEHVTVLDGSDHGRSLGAGLRASAVPPSGVTAYVVNTGPFPVPGVRTLVVDAACARSIGYARLINDAVATRRVATVPAAVDALVKALPLPARGALTTVASPAAPKVELRAFCRDPSRRAALGDLRRGERAGNIATFAKRAQSSPHAFIEFNNLMAFNDPALPKNAWTSFTPGIYSHHLFVAEIAHELFP